MFYLYCEKKEQDILNNTISKESKLKDLMDFYNKVPSYYDKYGIYYLNCPINLPKTKNGRDFILLNSIFYRNSYICIFKNNSKFPEINLDNEIYKEMEDKKELEKIKNDLMEKHSIVGFIIRGQKKDIIFKTTKNLRNYMSILREVDENLYEIELYSLEKHETSIKNILESGVMDFDIPFMYKQDLGEEREIMFVFSKNHKILECKTLKVFSFVILRFNKFNMISKISIINQDC